MGKMEFKAIENLANYEVFGSLRTTRTDTIQLVRYIPAEKSCVSGEMIHINHPNMLANYGILYYDDPWKMIGWEHPTSLSFSAIP